MVVLFGRRVRVCMNPEWNVDFWKTQPGLVWSNATADDGVRIRAALVRPRFGQLLMIAREFGAPRLRSEWEWLVEGETPEVARAKPAVERILGNIEKGFARAAATDE
jgi:hypothetical protein